MKYYDYLYNQKINQRTIRGIEEDSEERGKKNILLEAFNQNIFKKKGYDYNYYFFICQKEIDQEFNYQKMPFQMKINFNNERNDSKSKE